MIIDLSDRRAIVTASASGIGFAIALGLARTGATVVVNGRRKETTEKAVERLRAQVEGARVEGVDGDLSTAVGAAAFIDRAGEADILVNNLGIYDSKPFVEVTDEEWSRFFETNLFSGVRRHHLPRMMQRGWGRLLFITSESGVTPPAMRLHYATTKAAQIAQSTGRVPAAASTLKAKETAART